MGKPGVTVHDYNGNGIVCFAGQGTNCHHTYQEIADYWCHATGYGNGVSWSTVLGYKRVNYVDGTFETGLRVTLNSYGCQNGCKCLTDLVCTQATPEPTPEPTPALGKVGGETWLILVIVLLVIGFCAAVFFLRRLLKNRQGSKTPAGAERRLAEPFLASAPRGARMTVPSYWSNQDLRGVFHEVKEANKDQRDRVRAILKETYKHIRTRDRHAAIPKSLQMMTLQRVEDSRLWKRYAEKCDEIRQKRRYVTPASQLPTGSRPRLIQTLCGSGNIFLKQLDPNINEFYLWHGTSYAAVCSEESILHQGFRIDMAGSHAGMMFGKGAYFAECSSKADEYAHPGEGIHSSFYALLLCRVVCGEMFYIENPDAAAIDGAMRSGRYDSVLGDREVARNTYREFVVPTEAQIYPEYVIVYRRKDY